MGGRSRPARCRSRARTRGADGRLRRSGRSAAAPRRPCLHRPSSARITVRQTASRAGSRLRGPWSRSTSSRPRDAAPRCPPIPGSRSTAPYRGRSSPPISTTSPSIFIVRSSGSRINSLGSPGRPRDHRDGGERFQRRPVTPQRCIRSNCEGTTPRGRNPSATRASVIGRSTTPGSAFRVRRGCGQAAPSVEIGVPT